MRLLEMPEFKGSDLIAEDVNAMAEMSRAVKAAFPVGCIYVSFGTTSPQEILGGTWKKIEGRFLYAAGRTDTGENWHTPHEVGGSVAHRHLTSVGFDGLRFFGLMGAGWVPYYDSMVADRRNGINALKSGDIVNEEVRIAYTAHERNMPPFIVCNMWERTA